MVVTSILVVLDPLRCAQEAGIHSNMAKATLNARERREVEVMIVFSVDVTRKVIQVAVSRALPRCAKTHHVIWTLVQVFGPHAFDPLSPHLKAFPLQGPTHEGTHVVFLQPKLPFNRLKRRSVFPRHLDDPVQIFRRPILPRKVGALYLVSGLAGFLRRVGMVHVEVTPQTAQCSTLRPILGS